MITFFFHVFIPDMMMQLKYCLIQHPPISSEKLINVFWGNFRLVASRSSYLFTAEFVFQIPKNLLLLEFKIWNLLCTYLQTQLLSCTFDHFAVFLVRIIISISLTIGWKEKSEVRGFKQLVYTSEENLDLLYKYRYVMEFLLILCRTFPYNKFNLKAFFLSAIRIKQQGVG